MFYVKIKPKNLVLHDIFDGASINPHEMKDFLNNMQEKWMELIV